MRKIAKMPSRSQLARHATALAVLASFAACSHGSEPPHPLTKVLQTAPVVASVAPTGGDGKIGEHAKRGVIRAAEPVPAPEAAQKPVVAAGSGAARVVSAARSSSVVVETAAELPHPRLTEATAPESIRTQVEAERSRPTASTSRAPAEPQQFSYWPLYVGAGAVALSLLALALLRRRDREAAKQQREASELRAQELIRALERDQAAALEQAAELAAAQERLRATATAAAAAVVAPVREQHGPELANVPEHAQQKVDPRIEAAHRLFDLLHRAERDVEPFLQLLEESVPSDASSSQARQVVASWHESMLGTRNRLSEALTRHNITVNLQVVVPPEDLQNAVSRLIDHAARMSALMAAQQQQNSAILHWSRLLPGALVQLFWRAQTTKYSSTMTQLPRVPDTLAPGSIAAPAAPAPRTVRTQDKAIQQALRGVQRHAARA